jgi:aspartate aminotransferase
VTPEQVLVTVGATQALALTALAFLDPGDEVLVPDPGFVLFAPHVRLAGATPVFYPLEEADGFRPRREDLEARVTPRTKALVVNSPSNPTGAVLREREADALMAFARDHDLLVVSDEVYGGMVYERKHVSLLGRHENLVYVNSFSKLFAAPGWRLGYLVAPLEWMPTLEKLHYFLVACPPVPPQRAFLAGLAEARDDVAAMMAAFRRRRDRIVEGLSRIPGFRCLTPEGAFYAFPSFDHPVTSEELAVILLKAGVVCVPGSAFGKRGEGHLRFSYANTLENIDRALELVARVAGELRARDPG